MHAMKSFFAFAFCFAMLLGVWEKHYRFFRRFGLQHGWTVILNGLVLFVAVFYVYPLKFLSTLMLWGLSGESGDATLRTEDLPRLMAIYGSGFAIIVRPSSCRPGSRVSRAPCPSSPGSSNPGTELRPVAFVGATQPRAPRARSGDGLIQFTAGWGAPSAPALTVGELVEDAS